MGRCACSGKPARSRATAHPQASAQVLPDGVWVARRW